MIYMKQGVRSSSTSFAWFRCISHRTSDQMQYTTCLYHLHF